MSDLIKICRCGIQSMIENVYDIVNRLAPDSQNQGPQTSPTNKTTHEIENNDHVREMHKGLNSQESSMQGMIGIMIEGFH